jgi:hypothetical protein
MITPRQTILKGGNGLDQDGLVDCRARRGSDDAVVEVRFE